MTKNGDILVTSNTEPKFTIPDFAFTINDDKNVYKCLHGLLSDSLYYGMPDIVARIVLEINYYLLNNKKYYLRVSQELNYCVLSRCVSSITYCSNESETCFEFFEAFVQEFSKQYPDCKLINFPVKEKNMKTCPIVNKIFVGFSNDGLPPVKPECFEFNPSISPQVLASDFYLFVLGLWKKFCVNNHNKNQDLYYCGPFDIDNSQIEFFKTWMQDVNYINANNMFGFNFVGFPPFETEVINGENSVGVFSLKDHCDFVKDEIGKLFMDKLLEFIKTKTESLAENLPSSHNVVRKCFSQKAMDLSLLFRHFTRENNRITCLVDNNHSIGDLVTKHCLIIKEKLLEIIVKEIIDAINKKELLSICSIIAKSPTCFTKFLPQHFIDLSQIICSFGDFGNHINTLLDGPTTTIDNKDEYENDDDDDF